MIHIRSRVVMLVAVAVAACSATPYGPSGPPDVRFSATPADVAPGATINLSLRNASPRDIAALPCPLTLQRWDGSGWVALPDEAVLCAYVEDTLVPGGRYDRVKVIDPSAVGGTYRALITVDLLGTGSPVEVTSNTFNVMP